MSIEFAYKMEHSKQKWVASLFNGDNAFRLKVEMKEEIMEN